MKRAGGVRRGAGQLCGGGSRLANGRWRLPRQDPGDPPPGQRGTPAYHRPDGQLGDWDTRDNLSLHTETSYHAFHGQPLAVRQGEQVAYLHGDHLGSVSLITAYDEQEEEPVTLYQARYTPYGQLRWMEQGSPTDKAFTGQRSEVSLGLMDYQARFYSPSLGRFISPDSLIPDPGNPLSWDRFAYVQGNPLRYTDPSGHMEACADGDDCHYNQILSVKDYSRIIKREYMATLLKLPTAPTWNLNQVQTIFRTFVQMEAGIHRITGGNGKEWLQKNLGATAFSLTLGNTSFVLGGIVHLPSNFETTPWYNAIDHTIEGMIIHELGHVWDNTSKQGGGDACIFGGGYGDALMDFVGGSPKILGIRFAYGINIPPKNSFPFEQGPNYGNNSTDDYFAHAFSGVIIGSPLVPQLPDLWMAAMIDLSK